LHSLGPEGCYLSDNPRFFYSSLRLGFLLFFFSPFPSPLRPQPEFLPVAAPPRVLGTLFPSSSLQNFPSTRHVGCGLRFSFYSRVLSHRTFNGAGSQRSNHPFRSPPFPLLTPCRDGPAPPAACGPQSHVFFRLLLANFSSLFYVPPCQFLFPGPLRLGLRRPYIGQITIFFFLEIDSPFPTTREFFSPSSCYARLGSEGWSCMTGVAVLTRIIAIRLFFEALFIRFLYHGKLGTTGSCFQKIIFQIGSSAFFYFLAFPRCYFSGLTLPV